MRTARYIYFVIICCIFLLDFTVNAQQDHIRFNRLTINDGLSLSSVYTIFQDSKGFMWFGTEDGLNKFDGRKFQIFKPEPGNGNSLAYKWTELIYEDTYGQLWFGSKGGLTSFDPEIELFNQYSSQNENNLLLGDTIACLFEDHQGQLWIGTLSGINRINLETMQVDLTDLKKIQIYSIIEIEDEVWVGTDRGLYRFSRADNSFQPIPVDQSSVDKHTYTIAYDTNHTIWVGQGNNVYVSKDLVRWECITCSCDQAMRPEQIEQLLIDNNQNLWISASDGLCKYDPNTKEIKRIIRSIDTSHSLAINPTKSLYLDQKDNLWYGTFGNGVFRIDINTDRHINFRNNPADLLSLSENSINCIYEDRSGNIWFGTFGAGINIYDPKAHKFGFMSHQPLDDNSLSSNFVWSVMESKDGLLWIGTNDAGLNRYNPATNRFQKFDHNPKNQYSLSHSSVRKVYQDSKNRIWIGTDGGGLNRFYPNTNHFIHYMQVPDDPTSISNNSVRVIYEDRNGNLWIGTRSGLNLFDVQNDTFRRFNHDNEDPTSISNDFVYSAIYEGTKGYLWIGTYGGGLNKMDMETGKFKSYQYDPKNLESLSDNIVFSIYEDKTGIFWIGTNSGLDRFDPEVEKFKRFGISEGLPNEVIYGVLSDDNNNIWLSTNKGISRFNLDTYEVKNFSINDGLQSNEFNGGAFHRGKSGKIYFGGVYGLNIVDPTRKYIDENKSQVVITRFEILGKEVLTASNHNISFSDHAIKNVEDNYYLPNHISYTEEITLNYHHRFFSIEYAALNSSNADVMQYQYIMEGLDNKWNDAGKRNFITFANLQPGEYTLRVRSVNRDGIYCAAPAVLHIKITPPFWKTWWFYLIEIIIVLLIAGFMYRYLLKVRTNRLLKNQNEQINLANEKLLASENHLKELIATKDKFFSIVSHDLRNPFTSLLSISELMTKEYQILDEGDKIEGIKGIHDSANRIYKLLENLLTWSRAQSGSINYKPVKFRLENMVKENLSLHYEVADKKNITFETEIPQTSKAYGDRDMIGTVIRNLLGNAIKFSQKGKKIRISIDDADEFWRINVIDHGVGIAKDNLEKIFQIHTKFKSEGTEGEKGTGLGLIICKEFVEKNGGDISVVSEEGKGSTFSFTVPKAE